ncbi:hypothetical protein PG996_011861 [Apiospora saccharicola]|uniref:Small secreted protein n=1 Tax=Apiospora saccharicola TaxID=335842 RepID=A0ABR1UG94_9PEZI
MHFSTVTSSALYALVMAGVVVGAPRNMHQAAAAAKGNGTANAGTGAGANANAVKVQDTITAWQNAIKGVNTFVDNVLKEKDPKVVSSMAATAFKSAQVEGDSNTALQADVKNLDASGTQAAQALLAQFNIIGPAINDTIANPQNVVKNVGAINGAR